MTEPQLEGELRTARSGRVLQFLIDNPGAKNAMGPHMYGPAADAIEQAAFDDAIGIIVIAGVGDAFCSGGNVKRLRANRSAPRATPHASIGAFHRWVAAIRQSPKPVIAAIEGVAAGAGCSLALACDLLVAARDAKFVMSYVKIGLTPDGGGTASLAELLPRTFAAELLLEGGVVGAERLHQVGVVNRLSAPGAALADAMIWAAKLACGPPRTMARTKAVLAAARRNTFGQQLDLERETFLAGYYEAECDEGTAAFVEKRPPHFV